MKSFSPSDVLSARLTALFRCSKKSFAVGALLALANSAVAKFGSSAIALSKCLSDSCASNFSKSSRPIWNSFRASSEVVVIGIFPFSDAASAIAVLLQKLDMMALSRKIDPAIGEIDRWKRIDVPPEFSVNELLVQWRTRRAGALVSYQILDTKTSSKG